MRDQLKAGLSGAEAKACEPTVPELAERIKGLRGANTVEAMPERTSARPVSAEGLEAFVLQSLRQVVGKLGAHDALELVAWAETYTLANRYWVLYHEIGEIALPLKRHRATALECSFMSRYLGRALGKRDASVG